MVLFDYPGHLIATVLLVLIAAGIAFIYLSRHLAPVKAWAPLLAFLQYSSIVILLLILWNPSRPQTTQREAKNSVMVFFDTSQSMSVVERRQANRLDEALNTFQNTFLTAGDKGPEFKIFGFGKHCYRADSVASLRRWEQQTDLHDVLDRMNHYKASATTSNLNQHQFGENDSVGAVIFTDGQAEDKNINAYLPLHDKNFKVVIVGVGRKNPQLDIAVSSIKAPLQAGINTAYNVEVAVSGKHLKKDPVTIELLKDGYVIDLKEIAAASLTPETTVDFVVGADTLGRHVISARAVSAAAEVNQANNMRKRTVDVIDTTKLKVLFYSQIANFDIGKIRQALAADKKIDLDFGLDAIISPELSKKSFSECGHVKLPKNSDEFYKYDVIILGPCALNLLTTEQVDGLYSFVVDRAGGLVLLPGMGKYGPVAWENKKIRMLMPTTFSESLVVPVSAEKRSLELTLEGAGSNVINAYDLQKYDGRCSPFYIDARKKPAAEIIAKTGALPIVITHRVGRGCVCFINTTQLYQWYRQDLEGGLLGKFMSGVTSYTGAVSNREANVTLFADRQSENPDIVQFEAYVLNNRFTAVSEADVLLTVGDTVVKMQPVSQGRYVAQTGSILDEAITATVQAQQNGVFLGEKTIAVNLPLPLTEMNNIELDRDFLKALAKRVGGEYFDIDDVRKDTASTFEATRQVNDLSSMISIWPKWPLLLVLCLILSTGWFIRRALGLM